MAYDEKLADRIRQTMRPRPDMTEKKTFGGVAFLLDGKMFVARPRRILHRDGHTESRGAPQRIR
jgi:hypothetical protein